MFCDWHQKIGRVSKYLWYEFRMESKMQFITTNPYKSIPQ